MRLMTFCVCGINALTGLALAAASQTDGYPSASARSLLSTDYPTISLAIAACAEKGGGRVTVPAGTYETGPVHLKSNVELHFEEGAKLVFTDNPKAYLPGVPSSWNGNECINYSPLIYAYGCTNAAVTGKGVLAPRLGIWHVWRDAPGVIETYQTLKVWSDGDVPLDARDLTAVPNSRGRPQTVQLYRCKNVTLDGFSIRGTPFWTVHLLRSNDIIVRNLDINAWAEDGTVLNNSDGIDIEMSKDVLVENCTFAQNDDAIVIKAGRGRDGRRIGTPSERILIRNCTVNKGHVLLGIGSEVSGGIRDVRMENCRVNCEVWRLFLVKTHPSRGGFVKNITVDGIEAKKVTHDAIRIHTRSFLGQPGGCEVPGPRPYLTDISDIAIRNVHCEWAKRFVQLLGDPDFPVRNVTLENVVTDVAFEDFVKVENVDGIKLDVTAKKVYPDAHW